MVNSALRKSIRKLKQATCWNRTQASVVIGAAGTKQLENPKQSYAKDRTEEPKVIGALTVGTLRFGQGRKNQKKNFQCRDWESNTRLVGYMSATVQNPKLNQMTGTVCPVIFPDGIPASLT